MSLFDPAIFSGSVPLFPLPNAVLFPHTLLPLHIFEPRYRAMVADALSGERLIGMALLHPGWEADYDGNPPVHPVIGLGQVVQDVKLPDGRFNLVLCGVARARILEVVSDDPYRIAHVELLEEKEPDGEEGDEKRRRIIDTIKRKGGQVMLEAGTPAEQVPLGPLCDALAAALIGEPTIKQELLGELDVAARCDVLIRFLEKNLQLRPRRPAWPAEPSAN